MKTYDFVHVCLWLLGGEIKGRTKLQKTIYFLGMTATGKPEDLGFRAHFYGPYSEEVADAVDRLKSLGFLEESIAGGGGYDSRGFEVARYDIRLSEEGKEIARAKFEKVSVEEQGTLTDAMALFSRAGDADYVKLSFAAKTLFMLREKKVPATASEVAQLAAHFGWKVSEQQANEAFTFLQNLGLASLEQSPN